MRFVLQSAALVTAAGLLAGCHRNCATPDKAVNQQTLNQTAVNAPAMAVSMAAAEIGPSQSAATRPATAKVAGTVHFTESNGQLRMTAKISGLEPNSVHGFHIHEKGDLTAADLSSAGGHFDPAATHKHGDLGDKDVHGGDLGNLKADANGVATLDVTLEGVSLTGPSSIVGKAVIIHAKRDDLKSQPAGDSGSRVAGGVIKAVTSVN